MCVCVCCFVVVIVAAVLIDFFLLFSFSSFFVLNLLKVYFRTGFRRFAFLIA